MLKDTEPKTLKKNFHIFPGKPPQMYSYVDTW